MTGPLGLCGVVVVVLFVGVTNAESPKELVSPTNAAPGEFPYMVSLKLAGYHYCGGAIVGPRHILTTSSCVNIVLPTEYQIVSVTTGSVHIDDDPLLRVSKLISHPDYDRKRDNSENDIGIVVLAKDIVFNENQASLNLPTDLVPEGVLANLTSWGFSIKPRPDIYTETLMKTNVKVLRADSCRKSYLGDRAVQSNEICSSGGHVGMYDNGNPLVYNGQLIGVVASSNADGSPNLFSSVYHHLDWIQKTIKA